MPATWLDGFKGQHATVVTTAGQEDRTDTGVLVQIAEGFIQLAKDSGDMLLFPYSAVRLIKLLDMVATVPGLTLGAAEEIDAVVVDRELQPL
jgi:hypothetical protein